MRSLVVTTWPRGVCVVSSASEELQHPSRNRSSRQPKSLAYLRSVGRRGVCFSGTSSASLLPTCPAGFLQGRGDSLLTIDTVTHEVPLPGMISSEIPIDQAIFEVEVSIQDRNLVHLHITYLADLADQVELIIKALVDWM